MAETDPKPSGHASEPESEPAFRVEDKRHWARASTDESHADCGEVESPFPTVVSEYRARAESAERKLKEYIAAYRESQAEQERVRERLAKDADRRVALQYGAVLAELLTVLLASGVATIVALLGSRYGIGKFIPLYYGSSFSYIAAILAVTNASFGTPVTDELIGVAQAGIVVTGFINIVIGLLIRFAGGRRR